MIKYKAVLFGSIGTIIETSDLQRKAFNQAFKKNDLNLNNLYGSLQGIFKEAEFSGIENLVSDLHKQKKIIPKLLW